MAKKKINLSPDELTKQIIDLIQDDDDVIYKESQNILCSIPDKIRNYIHFAKGDGDMKTWVEFNRMIYGHKFSYEDGDISMMLGDYDKKNLKLNEKGRLIKAPRYYLNQYQNDPATDKSCIKCRQCLPGDIVVIVINDNGEKEYRTIEYLYLSNYRGKILYNKNGEYEKANVLDVWQSGNKDIIEIRTKSGNKLECSKFHKIWEENLNKFVYAKDLKKGNYLNVYKSKFGGKLNNNLAILSGYYFSDGTSYFSNGRKILNFRNKNMNYINEFINISKKYYRFYDMTGRNDCHFVFLNQDNFFRKKVDEWGLFGVHKKDKKIPLDIFDLNKESLSLFINRLFAGDGYISRRYRSKKRIPCFEIGILYQSIEFLIQLQELLYRFEIKSIIKKQFTKSKAWKLVISAKLENVLKFIKEIGIYDKTTKEDIKVLKNAIKYKKIFEKFKDYEDNQIVSIRSVNNQNTYDLSISDKDFHNFYANGILVSNSEMTENEINENIYLSVSRPYTNVRHIFPTAGMALKISKEKISLAIEKSPNIAKHLKRPYNLLSKNFDNGSFYTVDSSWTDYQGRGPSSDKLTFDEYEMQNPQIEDIFSESTSHSSLGKKVRISTPKFPNSGIDLMFNRGCGFHWITTCHKCKKEQHLEFPDNLINFFDLGSIDIISENYMEKLNKVYIGCKYCGAYIDRTSKVYHDNSRWIADRSHLIGDRASYRITYMMLPWKTGKEIAYKYHTFRFVHQFWNEIMGYAFVDKDSQVTREIFEQCQDKGFVNIYQRLGQAKNVSIGIDWGTVSWVTVIANGFLPDKRLPRVIYFEKIDNETLIKHGYKQPQQTDHAKRGADIAKFFQARIIVNDANGIGIDRNSYLVRKFPTRAYGCFYDTDERKKQRKKKNLIKPQWNEGQKTVTVSRVGSFKNLLQRYEEKRMTIPRLDPTIEEFVQHHSNLVIEKYEDETTGAVYEVIGKTGPDHACFASGTKIITNLGLKNIEDVKKGDRVLTRKGFKMVLNLWKPGKKLIRDYYINGILLRSTDYHKVWTTKGFKKIAMLTDRDVLFILSQEDLILWNELMKIQLNLKGCFLENIQNQKKDAIGYITRLMELIFLKVLGDCIKKYGKINMETFQKVIKFIIKTKIRKLMIFLIWSVSRKENTYLNILNKDGLKIGKNILNILITQESCQKNGTKQRRGRNFIKNMLNTFICILIKKIVKFAEKSIRQKIKMGNFVVKNVFPEIGEILELIMKKENALCAKKNLSQINIQRQNVVANPVQDVYDLEIEEVHEYFANGILVSNSHSTNYSLIGFERMVNTDRESNVGVINQSSQIGQNVLEQIRKTENPY